MKKLTRLASLLLALVMLLSSAAYATQLNEYTKEQYDADKAAATLSISPCGCYDSNGTRLCEEACTCECHTRLYEQVMACTSEEELRVLEETATQFDIYAFQDIMTEENALVLAKNLGYDVDGITPAVNYTKVAPLANGPVNVASKTHRLLRSGNDTPENGLILNKTAKAIEGTNQYQITLEAYTTGSVTSSEKAVPADVVLVLDESGSMADRMYEYEKVYELDTRKTYYYKENDTYYSVRYCDRGVIDPHPAGWYTGFHFIFHIGRRYEPMTSKDDTTEGHVQFYQRAEGDSSKRAALENAVKTFIDKVHSDAVINDVDHRVAVIGFANSSSIKIGLEDDIRTNYDTVINAATNLNANGGTYIENGSENAKSVFYNAAETSSTERKRVVVFFTDGIPGGGTWNRDTINNSANPAIKDSYELIHNYGATVYTIGMLDDANPTLEISDETDDAARTNKFLHYLSSNYPDAESMSEGGLGNNAGYYLAASDAASLEAIFEKISQVIQTPTIDLDESTVIEDTVTQYFDMPADTTAVTVTTYPCTSYNQQTGVAVFDTEADKLLKNAVTIDGQKVSVTGFNFNDNFVSETEKEDGTHGRKVVIQFTVTPKAGFLGGNGVPTNKEASVKKDDAVVESFEKPTVDVPIQEINVTAQDKNVYLMGTLTEENLKVDLKATSNGTDLLELTENSWEDDFVTVTTKFDDGTESAGTIVGTTLTDDQQYRATVTIEPNKDGEVKARSGSATANINVFKPELTYKDSVEDYLEQIYGDGTSYSAFNAYSEGQNFVKTEWWHRKNDGDTTADTKATDVTMIGTVPELTKVYDASPEDINEGKIISLDCISVDVTVNIGSEDIGQYVTFHHTCSGVTHDNSTGCEWDYDNSHLGNVDRRPEFLIHVINVVGDLKITKTGLEDGDTAIFTVNVIDKNGQSQQYEILLTNDQSVTIKDLKAGTTATVIEQGNWTWRYKTITYTQDKETAEGAQVTILGGLENSVTITNSGRNNSWLGGDAYCVNNYNADSGN